MAKAAREASAFAATDRERVEVKRRAAESILLLACSRDEPWHRVRASFEEVRALGFTDADRHVQTAALVARWCLDHGGHIDDALRELHRARLHVVRLRKDPKLRKRLLRQVAETERALAARSAR